MPGDKFNPLKKRLFSRKGSFLYLMLKMNLNSKQVYIKIILFVRLIGYTQLHKITQKIIQDVKPTQIVYFISETAMKNITKKNCFAQEVPVFMFKVDKKIKKSQSSLTTANIRKYIRQSLILIYTHNIDHTSLIIDLLKKLVPIKQRPKCFLILLSQKRSPEGVIKNNLKYAWKNKVLDFTILHDLLIYYYDPFHNQMVEQTINDDAIIFPEKLLKLNNYPIKIGVRDIDIPSKKREGQEVEWARHRLVIRFGLKMMGFDVQTIRTSGHQFNNTLVFSESKANIIAGLVVIRESKEKMAVITTDLPCRAVVAVVPVILVPKVVVPVKILLYVMVLPGIIICFILATSLMFETTQTWKIIHVVQMFLGQAVRFIPTTRTNQIVYVTICTLFVFITKDLYSVIVEINFGKEELSYDTYEDLDKSQMPIYSTSFIPALNYLGSNDPILMNLDGKIKTQFDCLRQLMLNKNQICVDWKYEAEHFIKKNRNSDGSAIMKVALPKYHCDQMFFRFEPGSPYTKRFSKVNRRIRESEIIRMEFVRQGLVERIKDVQMGETKDEKNLSKDQILFILVTGYSIATGIFLIELLIKSFRKVKF